MTLGEEHVYLIKKLEDAPYTLGTFGKMQKSIEELLKFIDVVGNVLIVNGAYKKLSWWNLGRMIAIARAAVTLYNNVKSIW